jgi:hypothetical protein
MATAFATSFLLVAPVWALMLLAPGWRVTHRLVASPWVVAPAAAAYVVAVVPSLGDVLAAVAPPQLAGVAALLGTPAGAMVAWAHFLAFDLFVARWIFLDSRDRVSHLAVAPILVATLMLGPVGLLAYLGVSSITGRAGRTPARPNRAT